MKIAVIGAGPAGLTAAYVLSKDNYQVDIYETSSQVGGMAGSFPLWGQIVDWGPHRYFSKDKRVNTLWLEVAGDDFTMVNRLTRIYYRGRFFLYPIQAIDACINLGFLEALKCLSSYVKEFIFPVKQDGSFETWVQHRFGHRLYEIFFKTYSEKLWGIPCTELDVTFASQRIKQLSLLEALQHALSLKKGNKHITLIDRFAYPLYGSGFIYKKMADAILLKGNQLFFSKPVKRVLTSDHKVTGIELFDGTIKWYDHVISTMPYTTLVNNLDEAPTSIKLLANQLTYRSTIIVYLLIDATNTFPDNWIYVHSKELNVGRITNFRNWSPSLYGTERKTILAMEYWCNYQDGMWNQGDETLFDTARKELARTGLVQESLIKEGYVLRIYQSYPVYSKGYTKLLDPIVAFTQSIDGLLVIGRNGSFKYNNQDHSILMGLLAAENIIGDKKHNLYSINTDYGQYQEANDLVDNGLKNK